MYGSRTIIQRHGGSAAEFKREANGSLRKAQAVIEAARDLAEGSFIPGISEAASLLSLVVNMVVDHKSAPKMMEKRVRMCQSLLVTLERAGAVLEQVMQRTEG